MNASNHTFVIPAYKDSPYLENCVLSLKNQALPTKIIIATATPSSFIESIAAKYDIPYFVSSKKPSIGGDWNFALGCADSQLVTIAHQDDLYDPNFTTEVLSGFHKHQSKNPLLVFTNYSDLVNSVDRKGSLNALVKQIMLLPFYINKCQTSKFFRKASLALGNAICCPSVTLDRVQTRNFWFSENLTCVLDWDAWLQLASEKGSFLYINKKLVKHRIHLDSETTQQIKQGKRYQEELAILSSIWGKRIGKLLAEFYIKGHNDNAINPKN